VRLLLDTHAWLWWVQDAPRLSRPARRAIANPANQCWLSMASAWEMALKISNGKLRIEGDLEHFLPARLAENGFALLPIDVRHVARTLSLPLHHRDPFDRLLIAQASVEGLAVVSVDSVFAKYDVRRIW
jgi:PIN domain nuclease of toxin-antitoxin system